MWQCDSDFQGGILWAVGVGEACETLILFPLLVPGLGDHFVIGLISVAVIIPWGKSWMLPGESGGNCCPRCNRESGRVLTYVLCAICFTWRLSPVAFRYCIICFAAARLAGQRLESFACLPRIDLLSAEITYEGEIINIVCMKTVLKDVFCDCPWTLLGAEPHLFWDCYGIGHENS